MATSSEGQPDASMISFNHYAYGAVIDWVYRNVAGIAPTAKNPGYRHITFAPRPGEGFTFASASVDTPLGVASIDWKIGDAGLMLATVKVPFGSKAVLDFPLTTGSILRVNGTTVANGLEVGHGTYEVLLSAPAIASFKVA
jgi:alpha-L-rhamnosidase